uniref:Uncharacterized protein n=1 Tax=Anguilla anguilla TaxID=7936 RepID=A0A0E9TTZ8_ANGAN
MKYNLNVTLQFYNKIRDTLALLHILEYISIFCVYANITSVDFCNFLLFRDFAI